MIEENASGFEYEDTSIKCFKEGKIAVLQIKANIFNTLVNFTESGKFFQLFELIEKDKEISSIFLYNEPDCLSAKQYDIFIENIYSEKGIKDDIPSKKISNKLLRTREIVVLNRFILNISNSSKLFVIGLQGNIATPFFGASLASDIRFGSTDLVFSFPHIKYKFHPGGALPFFISKSLNPGIAAEIIFKGEDIKSNKAMDLGLINKIIANDDFKENCIKEINACYNLDQCCIARTKSMMNCYSRKELQNYINKEFNIFI